MCRHFAWLGATRTLGSLIYAPSYGLPRQALLPRWQREGLINTDGHGVGWYPVGPPAGGAQRSLRSSGPASHGGPQVERHRWAVPIPMESDLFPYAAVAGTCLLGAVRSATPGMPLEEAAAAPFTNGRVLLSLNGHLDVSKVADLSIGEHVPDSGVDSAYLACLLWQRLIDVPDLEQALVGVVNDVIARDPNACLNLLAVDGERIVATTWHETLCYRVEADGVLVASEPSDDNDDWTVLDNDVVIAVDRAGVTVKPLRTSARMIP